MMGSENHNSGDRTRFDALDAWRGIAAMLVALYRLEADGWLTGIGFVKNAYLFVDFFFVLSGFVIAYAYLDRLRDGSSTLIFLIRRFGRVWPLHAALLLLIVGFEMMRGLMGWMRSGTFTAFVDARAPMTILWDGLLVQALGFTGPTGWNTPAWSISTEFWTYIVFAVLCFGGRRLVMLAAPVLIFGGLAIVAACSKDGMNATFDFGFARCLAGFFSGVLVYALWRATQDVAQGWLARSYVAGPLECLVILAAFAFVAVAGTEALSLCAPFIFAIMVYVFAFERGFISSILSGPVGQLFGKLSYSIYMNALLISLVFNKGAVAVFGRLGKSIASTTVVDGQPHHSYDFGIPLANDAYTLIYLGCVFGVSWLTYRMIEDPARKLFNSWSRRFA